VSTSGSKSGPITGITEEDIADYLINTPGFFERQSELLATVQLQSPHGGRAVSLQERQMEMLRERIKGLERKIMEMIRNGQENVAISDRLHRWTRAVLLERDPKRMPAVLIEVLQDEFMIPQASLRLWNLAEPLDAGDFTAPVSEDLRTFAASLSVPYCGLNSGFEAAQWLADAHTVTSIALVPLRQGEQVFGLVVLGSPDPTRYSADMGTEFLQRIGELAGAGLARLAPPA